MNRSGDAIPWDDLVAAAFRAQAASYSPYSGYRVGAALLAEDGRVFVGTNVENASYGLCLCAERSAIAAAVVSGAQRFAAIAIVSPGDAPASPCGMCRQVLAELGPPFAVRCVAEGGGSLDTSTDALLPFAFTPAVLEAGRDPMREVGQRSTLLSGTDSGAVTIEGTPRRSTRPPHALDGTRPDREAFVVGVALKVAAGTGTDLAKQQQAGEAIDPTVDEARKKSEGE